MTARVTTAEDLVRALRGLTRRPAVGAALRERAEALAAAIAEAGGEGVSATVAERGPGEMIVTASGPGLFAREFGSLAAPAEPVVAPAVEEMRGSRLGLRPRTSP
jgi:hypothetical protein